MPSVTTTKIERLLYATIVLLIIAIVVSGVTIYQITIAMDQQRSSTERLIERLAGVSTDLKGITTTVEKIAAIVGAPPPPAPPPPPKITVVKIGVLFPLSGAIAKVGAQARLATEIAVEHINAEGGIKSLGGAKIELIFGDCTSDPKTVMSETERFIAAHGHEIAFIIGMYASSLTFTGSEVTERYKVPLLTVSATDPITERGFEWLFRSNIKASYAALSILGGAVDIGNKKGIPVKTVASFYAEDPLGTSYAKSIRENAEKFNLTLLGDYPFPPGTKDVSAIGAKLKANTPDLLMVNGYGTDPPTIIRTLAEMDILPKIIVATGGGFVDPSYVEIVGKKTEYVCSLTQYAIDMAHDPMNKPFLDEFIKRFGEHPGEPGGLSYQAAWAAKYVLETAGALHSDDPLSRKNIRDAFLHTDVKGFNHPDGTGDKKGFITNIYGFKPTRWGTGDNEYAYPFVAFIQYRDLKLRTVWPFKVATLDVVYPLPPWAQR